MKNGALLNEEIYRQVDDFLAKRMRPDNPLKQCTESQKQYAREWYRRKREAAKRKV